MVLSGNNSGRLPQHHQPMYFEKYQARDNHRHKTSDPKYAEHWGEYRQLILYPHHLPDLFTPTVGSFRETMPRPENPDLMNKFITTVSSRKRLFFPALAYFFFLSILIFGFLGPLLMHINGGDVRSPTYIVSSLLKVLAVFGLLYYTPALGEKFLEYVNRKMDLDTNPTGAKNLLETARLAIIPVVLAIVVSLFGVVTILDAFEHLKTTWNEHSVMDEFSLEEIYSFMKTAFLSYEARNSLLGTGGFVILIAIYQQYKEYERRWTGGVAPEWKAYNKEKVFKDWIREYYHFLDSENLHPDFSLAMSKLIHIYSLKNHQHDAIEEMNGTYFLEQWDGEDGNEKTNTLSLIAKYNEQLKVISARLPDALASMKQTDRNKYRRFQGFSESQMEEILNNASPNRYQLMLTDTLIENTDLLENDDIRNNWRRLLENGTPNDRKVKPMLEHLHQDPDQVVDNEMTLEAWLSKFLQNSNDRKAALLAGSGYGKTTSVYQAAIELLRKPTEDGGVLPLIIKARNIRDLEFDGNLNIIENKIAPDDAYVSHWLEQKSKLMIIDGLDEVRTDQRHFVEHIHKASNFYNCHLLVTSRTNLRSRLKTNFQVVDLIDVSIQYREKLILSSSKDIDSREIIRNYCLSNDVKQPLLIFGLAQMLANSTKEGDLNLSSFSIARWRFESMISERIRKSDHQNITSDRMATGLGDYIISTAIGKEPDEKYEKYMQIAFDWQIVDNNGLLDDEHEGYCLGRYLYSKGNDEQKEALPKIIEMLTKLYHNEAHYDRWDAIASCLISSGGPIKLRHFYEGMAVETRKQHEHEIHHLIKLSRFEWTNGDAQVKKDVLDFCGFSGQLVDEKCRLRLTSETIENFTNDNGLPWEDYVIDLLDFHCYTWLDDQESWYELEEDGTWKTLHELLFDEGYIHLFGKLIDEGLDRLQTEMNSISMDDDGEHSNEQKDLNKIGEYLKGLKGAAPLRRRVPWLDDKDTFAVVENQIFREFTTFDRPQLIPRKKTIKQQRHIGGFPKILNSFMITRLQDAIDNPTVDECDGALKEIYLWLVMVSHLQSYKPGDTTRMQLFSLDYDEVFYHKLKAYYDELDQNNKGRCVHWLVRIYRLLRNDEIVDYDPNGKLNVFSDDCSLGIHETTTSPQMNAVFFDNETKSLQFISKDEATENQSFWVSRNTSGAEIGLPFQRHVVDGEEIPKGVVGPIALNAKKGKVWADLRTFEDGIVWQKEKYASKLYSIVPIDLLRPIGGWQQVYATGLIFRTEEYSNAEFKTASAFLPWYTTPSNIMLEYLEGEYTINRCMKIDAWQNKLREDGANYDVEQVIQGLENEGISLDEPFYGICDLRQGPDELGFFWIHLLRGSSGNDIFVEETAKASYNQLLRLHQGLGDHGLAYLRFDLEVKKIYDEDIPKTIFSPINLTHVCRGCFRPVQPNEFKQSSQSLCLDCYKAMCGPNPVQAYSNHMAAIRLSPELEDLEMREGILRTDIHDLQLRVAEFYGVKDEVHAPVQLVQPLFRPQATTQDLEDHLKNVLDRGALQFNNELEEERLPWKPYVALTNVVFERSGKNSKKNKKRNMFVFIVPKHKNLIGPLIGMGGRNLLPKLKYLQDSLLIGGKITIDIIKPPAKLDIDMMKEVLSKTPNERLEAFYNHSKSISLPTNPLDTEPAQADDDDVDFERLKLARYYGVLEEIYPNPPVVLSNTTYREDHIQNVLNEQYSFYRFGCLAANLSRSVFNAQVLFILSKNAPLTGKFIGKGGKNKREVEERLGCRVIVSEPNHLGGYSNEIWTALNKIIPGFMSKLIATELKLENEESYLWLEFDEEWIADSLPKGERHKISNELRGIITPGIPLHVRARFTQTVHAGNDTNEEDTEVFHEIERPPRKNWDEAAEDIEIDFYRGGKNWRRSRR